MTQSLIAIFFLASAIVVAQPIEKCAGCHPKEVAGFAKSAMGRSMRVAATVPEGAFEHAVSGTHFEIRNTSSGVMQALQRPGERQALTVQYEIGSGSHAFGYVAQVGDHLFQSPISYYVNRKAWDVAPGYEEAKSPDFSRPVTAECLSCHADKPLPVRDTLNRFESPPFAGTSIACERCHGPSEAHVAHPVSGSIINPAKLGHAERDSVCEQCHLTGEIRIPNPEKTLTDFRPGQRLEDVFTVYVESQDVRNEASKRIKVVSQAEELALSVCARSSGGKLWCGTCHNAHDVPVRPAAYFREKCLSCHASTLTPTHAGPERDCIGCHMPKRDAKDGGHTAFTDHRITRRAEAKGVAEITGRLTAWREPVAPVQSRNMALALVTHGFEKSDSDEVIRGFRALSQLEAQYVGDADVESTLGTVLLRGKQAGEAQRRFSRALALRPGYAPYQVNLAVALIAAGDRPAAKEHLERAVELDPLLQQAVELLSDAYRRDGDSAKADEVVMRYRTAMGIR